MEFLIKKAPPKKTLNKKAILIWIASLAGAFLLAALGWFIVFKLQFATYEDPEYKFSIEYPARWKMVPHPQKAAVGFIRPKDTVMDPLWENFNITIQPLPDGITSIAQFSAAVKTQMTGTFSGSIKVTEDKPLHFDWREGHEMIFESLPPDPMKMVTAWVFRDTQVYILTFLGDKSKYANDRFIVDEMIHSLRFQ